MTRKKKVSQTETLAANPEDSPTPSPEGQALLAALRSNLSLLGELAMRYEVETQPERPKADLPSINTPRDVYNLLGKQMSALAQEQLRVLLLDRRNRVLGQRTVYQGNVFSQPRCSGPPWSSPCPPSLWPTTIHPRTRLPARRTCPSPGTWPRRASSWASSFSTTWSSAARALSASKRGG